MIKYNVDRFGIFFAFRLSGSVFPKSFGFAMACSVLTTVLHWILEHQEWKDDMDIGSKGTTVVSMFTFVLGFLLVFRTQQAYSRWWEGGSLLQELRGEWFNAFSCLVAFNNAAPEKRQDVDKFNHQLGRLLSMLHAAGLAQVCSTQDKHFEVIDLEDFDNASLEFLKQDGVDSCEIALQWIQRLIGQANAKELIKVAPPILSRVYNQLGNGIVKLSGARKIANFPIPFPFAQMVTVMLLTHWILAAIVCATSIESRAWSALLSFAVIISFWSMNFIALELEDPFGNDANDLPLVDMQKALNDSIKSLMMAQAMEVPKFNFNMAFHDQLHINTYDFNCKLHLCAKKYLQDRPKTAFEDAEKLAAMSEGAKSPKMQDARKALASSGLPPTDAAKIGAQSPAKAAGVPPLAISNGNAPPPVQAASATPSKADQVVAASPVSTGATEHLSVAKGLAEQLTKVVTLLEKNGAQLGKQNEMQGQLYHLHCDFYEVLTSLEKIPRPTIGDSPSPFCGVFAQMRPNELHTAQMDPRGASDTLRTEASVKPQLIEPSYGERQPLLTAAQVDASEQVADVPILDTRC